jgi:hypothetical protein
VRLRFQFRLRTLFAVTAIVAVWAWFTRLVPPAIEMIRFDKRPQVYEPNIEWFVVTASACLAIWILMRRPALGQRRKTDQRT